MREKFGIQAFDGVCEAIRAGYEILSVYPDRAGYLHARMKVDAEHYALALIRVRA